jgi:peptidylprolyl isomerase
MKPGESKIKQIPYAQAYGPHRPEMVAVVDRAKMPKNLKIELGKQLDLPSASGQTLSVSVTQIEGSQVTLDVNHPLAGQDLTFEIHLISLEPWPRN